ncbi:polysaccharide deacetylase family protein [Streptomyces sp. NPDC059009]|uniref:polysaccharide deacetylase family protein n=1 Tax=Streptomyces sp. NPDC059009 TaxID=3346694 RepID=UPI0036CEA7E0
MSTATDRRVGLYLRYEQWHGLDRALLRSPAQPLFTRRAARRLAVLGYHGVEDPAAFAAQLDHLHARACPVSLRQVEAALHEGRPLPARAVLVTFDDGERSVLTHGLPLLRERGIPAVCFVVAGLVGTDEPFWWDGLSDAQQYALKQLPYEEFRRARARLPRAPRRPQLTPEELRELRDGGVEIGNHTLTHPRLDRCADTVVREEVTAAHELLTGHLGTPPGSFAYPNGDFDARADRLLAGLGYRTGFRYDHRLTDPADRHPLRLSRLRVSTRTTPARFETALSGLQPAVYRAGLAAFSAARRLRGGGSGTPPATATRDFVSPANRSSQISDSGK